MKLAIDQRTYESLNDEDKLQACVFLIDPEFKNAVSTFRENVGIPQDGWGSISKNYYGLGLEQEMYPFVTDDENGETVVHGSWSKKRKLIAELQKKIKKELKIVISKFNVKVHWYHSLEMYLCYGEHIAVPTKISFIQQSDGSVSINIRGKLKSVDELRKWIDENWVVLEEMMEINYNKPEVSIPRYGMISQYSLMFQLKEQEMDYKQISKVLEKELQKPAKKLDEVTLANSYKRVKEALVASKKKNASLKIDNVLAGSVYSTYKISS